MGGGLGREGREASGIPAWGVEDPTGVDAGARSEAVAVEVDGTILISTSPGLSAVPSTELVC